MASDKPADIHWQGVYRLLKEDTTYATVFARACVIRDKKGSAIRVVGAIQDITQQKQSEQEREQLISELTRSNQELQQFTYITSHNFRAPLSNLLGLLEIMKDLSIEDPLLAEMIKGFYSSTTALNDTVNDLINVLIIKDNPSKAKEEIQLREVYDKIHNQIRISIDEASADIQYDDSQAPVVFFDRSYLESILLNLLTNALKYRSCTRKLTVSITTQDAGESVVLIFKDNGIGMDIKRYGDRLFGLY